MEVEFSLSKLQEDIHNALKSWHSSDITASPLDYLQLFRQIYHQEASNTREATNQILLRALDDLMAKNKRNAILLRKRFLDRIVMYSVANSLNIGQSTAFRLQNEALEQLAQIVYDQEQVVREAHFGRLKSRLELPMYSRLIGVERHLNHLCNLLSVSEPPWLVSINGLGGIGKTSLADAISRQIIEDGLFDDFAWVSARKQIFNPGQGIRPVETPALTVEDLVDRLIAQLMPDLSRSTIFSVQEGLTRLQAKLSQGRHLIVIDNLETIVDLETLLPSLRLLANPTKFLLTSRRSLHHESGVYHFNLPELKQADALRLIRHEAQLHNLPYLNQADDESLRKIYEIVGGNPLALRLVVGQTHIHSLEMILADLEQARGQKADLLYTFIYRHAWDSLDELTRRVFLAMPLVTEKGGNLDYLGILTGLSPVQLRDALGYLVTLNLVDSKGNLTERRYTIHNLTRTFLQDQVAKWEQ